VPTGVDPSSAVTVTFIVTVWFTNPGDWP